MSAARVTATDGAVDRAGAWQAAFYRCRGARVARDERAAGFVLVRGRPRHDQVLVLRAWRNWDFPKGRVEPGESLLATARRETREETGLDQLDLVWGEASIDTDPYAGGKVATFFVAAVHGGTVHLPLNATLGRAEHHAFRWLRFDAARGLLVPRLQRVLDWAQALVESAP
jgi:bis(5'-nucleosidyl)-tetraphosphatase